MKKIEIQIPEVIYQQASELAGRENMPVDQVLSLAVAQTIGVWCGENYVALRNKELEQAKFLEKISGMIAIRR